MDMTATQLTPAFMGRRPDRATRAQTAIRHFLATYEPIWESAVRLGGVTYRIEDLPVRPPKFLQNMYRARAVLTKRPQLRTSLGQHINLGLLTIMRGVDETLYIGPKAKGYTARRREPSKLKKDQSLPPSNVVMFDNKTQYLAMLERAAIDPMYLPEANLIVQCVDLADCARVLKDVAKVGATDSVVDEERKIVIIIADPPTQPPKPL